MAELTFSQKNWYDITNSITKRMKRTFPGAVVEDVEDAVGGAVLNLLDVWMQYPAVRNIEDINMKFNFAVFWGTRRAAQYLWQRFEEMEAEQSLDQEFELDGEDHTLWDVVPSTDPGPEELVLAAATKSLATELLETLPPGELRRWVKDTMNGVTERACAKRDGVAKSTVHDRRSRCKARVQRMVCGS